MDEDKYLERQERLVDSLLFLAAAACGIVIGGIVGLEWVMGKMGW